MLEKTPLVHHHLPVPVLLLCKSGTELIVDWIFLNNHTSISFHKNVIYARNPGRFARGSFRPESFRPGFMGGSFRPY